MKQMKLTLIMLVIMVSSLSYSLEIEYDDYVAEIGEAFYLKDYEAALYLSDSALQDFPDATELINFKADALFALGKYKEAFSIYKKFLPAESKKGLESSLEAEEKIKRAELYYKVMYSLRELNKEEQSGSKKANNVEKIYKYYEKYHELDNYSDFEKIYELGNMYVKDSLFEKAYLIFTKDESDYYKNLFGAALMARFLGKYNESINLYKKLLKSEPELEEAYFGLAIAYRLNGDFPNAIDNFRRHLEYKQVEESYIAIAEMEMVMGKYGSAKAMLEIGKREFPKSKRMEELLIEIYTNSKN